MFETLCKFSAPEGRKLSTYILLSGFYSVRAGFFFRLFKCPSTWRWISKGIIFCLAVDENCVVFALYYQDSRRWSSCVNGGFWYGRIYFGLSVSFRGCDSEVTFSTWCFRGRYFRQFSLHFASLFLFHCVCQRVPVSLSPLAVNFHAPPLYTWAVRFVRSLMCKDAV
jgi:hypothetical protein